MGFYYKEGFEGLCRISIHKIVIKYKVCIL